MRSYALEVDDGKSNYYRLFSMFDDDDDYLLIADLTLSFF